MWSIVVALLGSLRSALRGRGDLVLENIALRQQLALLHHRSKRPQFGRFDRAFWVQLSRRWPRWRDVLLLVQPETVIRWHRQGFRAFWTWKSRHRGPGRPSIGSELRALIREMAYANPLWGAPRSMASSSSSASPSRSVLSPDSCCVREDHPRNLGRLSSRTTSPTWLPSTSWSCPRRRSGSSSCSWSWCTTSEPADLGDVVALPQVGGLHHRYTRRAA